MSGSDERRRTSGEEGLTSWEREGLAKAMENLLPTANLERILTQLLEKFAPLEQKIEELTNRVKEVEDAMSKTVDEEKIAGLADTVRKTDQALRLEVASCRDEAKRASETEQKLRLDVVGFSQQLDGFRGHMDVQDRILHEMQEGLRDKATLGELTLVETQIKACASKDALAKLEHKLNDFALVGTTEGLASSIQHLARRFDDYWRGPQIENSLQDVRDWVSEALNHYAKLDDTSKALRRMELGADETSKKMQQQFALLDEKHLNLQDRVTAVYVELNEDIQKRAHKTTVEDVRDELLLMAKESDLEALKEEAVPRIQFCVDSMQTFNDRINLQDSAIQRLDELLLDKASKYDIVVANAKVEQCMPKDKAYTELQRLSNRLDTICKRLDHFVESESERISQYKPSEEQTDAMGEFQEAINLKADKSDLIELHAVKANRIDVDQISVFQEQIQRQLEYLAVTSFGMARLTLAEAKPNESKMLRQQQRTQVLTQAEHLWHWIVNNQPPPNLAAIAGPAASPSPESSRRRLSALPASDQSTTSRAPSISMQPSPSPMGTGVPQTQAEFETPDVVASDLPPPSAPMHARPPTQSPSSLPHPPLSSSGGSRSLGATRTTWRTGRAQPAGGSASPSGGTGEGMQQAAATGLTVGSMAPSRAQRSTPVSRPTPSGLSSLGCKSELEERRRSRLESRLGVPMAGGDAQPPLSTVQGSGLRASGSGSGPPNPQVLTDRLTALQAEREGRGSPGRGSDGSSTARLPHI
ncbi:unnamed protein product [Vitrella brassicaformis CCMP3155]|uniref:Uncharacterized protein n=3 Tax=Vitrella brassicaformis TaxID=1169539 RepID=A0A0G4FZ98_VITBC|nr:unnamed protein product [Vitrella brassicaformis CCMP3155]|eukprot:CEM20848.1 unnamed protein product [Vitrella brassicaformis CCMP3155]